MELIMFLVRKNIINYSVLAYATRKIIDGSFYENNLIMVVFVENNLIMVVL